MAGKSQSRVRPPRRRFILRSRGLQTALVLASAGRCSCGSGAPAGGAVLAPPGTRTTRTETDVVPPGGAAAREQRSFLQQTPPVNSETAARFATRIVSKLGHQSVPPPPQALPINSSQEEDEQAETAFSTTTHRSSGTTGTFSAAGSAMNSLMASFPSSAPPLQLEEQAQASEFPLPAAGAAPAELGANMGQRLSEDSKTLGSAAEQLLGVQADLNRVQNEVEGQVFDLETVRQFFAEHQYLSASKRTLEEKNAALQNQVAVVGAELAEAQAAYANTTAVLQSRALEAERETKKLRAQEAEVEKEYIGHRVAIAEDEKVRAENSELLEKMEHMNRLETAKASAEQDAAASRVLAKKEAKFALELQDTIASLRGQVADLKKAVAGKDAVLVDHVKQLKEGAKKIEEADKTRILSLEQSEAELRSQLAAAVQRADSLTGKNRELEDLLKSVQQQAVGKFEQLKAKIGQYKSHIVTLRESVAQNVLARKSAEAENQRLTDLMLKSDAQTLKRQLDEVKKAHEQSQADLRDMSTLKAKAEAALVEEESARAAAENIAGIEKQAAEKARLEKTEKVSACEKSKAEELAVKGKELMACQSAMNSLEEEKCGVRWAELNKESVLQIEKCKKDIPLMKEKITTLSSEVAVLQAASNGKLCAESGGTEGAGGSGGEAGETSSGEMPLPPEEAAGEAAAAGAEDAAGAPPSLVQQDLPDEAADQAAITGEGEPDQMS
eukprot:CAMPEP_0178987576 /NCGR_PEP_ID=MMETSP0795-20121207/3337_1 /TAXON_ID=88552 /ORGANISM="Amoebophrya sp., Strain Ameob2" /LENGTH=726 /DNA_ID=CAMNT_0020678765 /DNA_START=53 /DNA_END=2233 /DNA_ORIENTATION=+